MKISRTFCLSRALAACAVSLSLSACEGHPEPKDIDVAMQSSRDMSSDGDTRPPEVRDFPATAASFVVNGPPSAGESFVQDHVNAAGWFSRHFIEGSVFELIVWPAIDEPPMPNSRRQRRTAILFEITKLSETKSAISVKYLASSRGFAERTWSTTPDDMMFMPAVAKTIAGWFSGGVK